MREKVTLICTECKRKNYITTKRSKTSSLKLKKYCRFCGKHILHKEK